MHQRHLDSRFSVRIVAVVTAVLAVIGVLPPFQVLAAPGGMVSLPNEPISPSSNGAVHSPGDGKVSSKTGAFDFQYPIAVPPTQRGVAPVLALRYSSRFPIYGDIASGWTLDGIPEIKVDTSKGRSLSEYGQVPTTPYVSTLAGGARLIEVGGDPVIGGTRLFRAQGDSTYARYELIRWSAGQLQWRVRTTDGTVYHFGDWQYLSGTPQSALRTNAPLTEIVDAFGNSTRFFYRDGRIDHIDYAFNPAANLGNHARVSFEYVTPPVCAGNPVGAQLSYRTGTRRLVDAGKLKTIRTWAVGSADGSLREVRRYQLEYDESAELCDAPHGPQRNLVSIQETALAPDGTQTRLPATTLEYGRRDRELTETMTWQMPASPQGTPQDAIAWGTRNKSTDVWATVESMLLDFDGDGYQDRVYITDNRRSCEVGWDRGGPSGFQPTGQRVALPTLPWKNGSRAGSGEGCSLTAQVLYIEDSDHPRCGTGASYFAYRFLDVDGDGQLELATALNYDPHGLRPKNVFELGLPNPDCQPEVRDTGHILDGPECRLERTPHRATCNDFLYVWYIYEKDDVGGFEDEPWVLYSPVELAADVGNTGMGAGMLTLMRNPEGLSDLNGDGFLDAFSLRPNFGGARNPAGDEWRVWFGSGDSFDGPYFWRVPDGKVPQKLVGNLSRENNERRRAMADLTALYDVNGDGLPDLIDINPKFEDDGSLRALAEIYYNDGSGFDVHNVDLLYQENLYTLSTALIDYEGWEPFAGYIEEGWRWSSSGPVDVDSDGRVDWYWPVGVPVSARLDDADEDEEDEQPSSLPTFNPNPGGLQTFNGLGELDLSGFGASAASWNLPGAVPTMPGVPVDPNPRPVDPSPGTPTPTPTEPDTPPDSGEGDEDDGPDGTVIVYGDELEVAFNAGGSIVPPRPVSEELRQALKEEVRFEEEQWIVKQRLTDVTGDGLPDSVRALPGGRLRVATDARDAGPLRLLRSVDNGRGKILKIDYRPHTDREVVTQAPALGRSMSSPTWVVSEMTVTDAFGPSSITSFHYNRPVVKDDWLGRFGFRGFESVQRKLPSGAVSVERFDYSLDPNGRPVSTLLYTGGWDGPNWFLAPGALQSVDETRWGEFSLFDGEVVSYHKRLSATWTCLSEAPAVLQIVDPVYLSTPDFDRDVRRCQEDELVATHSLQWSPFPRGSEAELYAVTGRQKLLRPIERAWETSPVQGEIVISQEYEMESSSSRYHLVQTRERVTELPGLSVVGITETQYDEGLRVPVRVSSLVSDEGGQERWATIEYEYDYTTGLATSRTKPQQYADGGPSEHYEYDPFGVYLTRTVNEVGHEVTEFLDYGTGAVVRTLGPGFEACSTCKFGKRFAEQRIEIDGLGRPLEERTSHGDTYEPQWVARYTYEDMRYEDVRRPVRVTERRRLEFGSDEAVTTRTELDGSGRIIREVRDAGPGAVDPITEYEFDGSGKLEAVRVPDPSNDAARVEYTWRHDQLGRPTRIRRPDGTGSDLSYFGLETTTQDYVPGAASDEPRGSIVEARDALGRVIQVRELTSAQGWATTDYFYDGNSLLSAVVHADGREVRLEHDLAGNRLATQVGESRWSYAYDLNGNLRAKTAPHSSLDSAITYTSSFLYDDIDRVVEELPAIGNLDDSTRKQLAVGPKQYQYDLDPGGVGKVGRVALPWGTIEHRYELRGLKRFERRSVNLSGALETDLEISDVVSRRYNAMGEITELELDGPDGPKVFRYSYNALGYPQELFRQNDFGAIPISRAVWGAAGNIRRWEHFGGQQTHSVSYDEVGQVIAESVSVDGRGEQLSEVIDYFGAGDVRAVGSIHAGLTPQSIEYRYDAQHQVIGAEGTTGYRATYGYDISGRLVEASVSASGEASSVRPKDVLYEFDDPRHPEAVTRLDSRDERPSVDYAYDDAGNVIRRDEGDGNVWRFAYDGDNLQRRVQGPGGETELYYYAGPARRVMSVRLSAGGTPVSATLFAGNREIRLGGDGEIENVRTDISLGNRRVLRMEDGDGGQETVFTYHNRLGHLMGALRPDGTVEAALVQGAFGDVVAATGERDAQSLAFNAKRRDDVSGLIYYGYRYFDRTSQMWTQMDPLLRYAPDVGYAQPRRLNLYSFSLNNPNSMVDPDGRDSRAPRSLTYRGRVGNATFYVEVPNTHQGIYGNNADAMRPTTRRTTLTVVSDDGAVQTFDAFVETRATTDKGWREVGEQGTRVTQQTHHRTIISGGIAKDGGTDGMNMGIAHDRVERTGVDTQTYAAPGIVKVSYVDPRCGPKPYELLQIGTESNPTQILVDKDLGKTDDFEDEHRWGGALGILQRGLVADSPDGWAVLIDGVSEFWMGN